MLRRFLRNIGRTPREEGPRAPSYGETILAEARSAIGARLDDSKPADVMARLADCIFEAEVARGAKALEPLDEPARTAFARSYLALLLDNDALPPALHLTEEEIRKPRELLHGFYEDAPNLHAQAQEILKLIEKKFAEGYFAQAALLLQLFDTEAAVRRNNERNLFYEEMILRFMSTRSQSVTDEQQDELRLLATEGTSAPVEALPAIVSWLADNAGIRLHVRTKRPHDVEAWTQSADGAEATARNRLLEIVPPARWRLLSEQTERNAAHAIEAHLRQRGLEPYLLSLVRAVYFIVLAPGATGFEPLVIHFMRWAGGKFDERPTRILPELHRRTTLDEQGLGDALSAIYEQYLAASSFGSGAFTIEAIEEAIGALQRDFAELDLSAVPEGDYDLGGLVLDRLTEFRPEKLHDALRVHRLC